VVHPLYEEGVENLIFGTLENTGDGQLRRTVVLDQIVLGILEGTLALIGRRVLSEPNENLRSGIKNESISCIKLGARNGTIGDLGENERTGGIREAEELLGEARGNLVVTTFFS
jgi:hypothetical protein